MSLESFSIPSSSSDDDGDDGVMFYDNDSPVSSPHASPADSENPSYHSYGSDSEEEDSDAFLGSQNMIIDTSGAAVIRTPSPPPYIDDAEDQLFPVMAMAANDDDGDVAVDDGIAAPDDAIDDVVGVNMAPVVLGAGLYTWDDIFLSDGGSVIYPPGIVASDNPGLDDDFFLRGSHIYRLLNHFEDDRYRLFYRRSRAPEIPIDMSRLSSSHRDMITEMGYSLFCNRPDASTNLAIVKETFTMLSSRVWDNNYPSIRFVTVRGSLVCVDPLGLRGHMNLDNTLPSFYHAWNLGNPESFNARVSEALAHFGVDLFEGRPVVPPLDFLPDSEKEWVRFLRARIYVNAPDDAELLLILYAFVHYKTMRVDFERLAHREIMRVATQPRRSQYRLPFVSLVSQACLSTRGIALCPSTDAVIHYTPIPAMPSLLHQPD